MKWDVRKPLKGVDNESVQIAWFRFLNAIGDHGYEVIEIEVKRVDESDE